MTENMDTDSGQSQNKSFEGKDFPYQNAVGALLFLVQAPRPDLVYAVSTLNQYNTCYDEMHWSLVKIVFRYLQGTKDYKLQYSKGGTSRLRRCELGHQSRRSKISHRLRTRATRSSSVLE